MSDDAQEMRGTISICPVRMPPMSNSTYRSYGEVVDEEISNKQATSLKFRDCALNNLQAKNCTFVDCALTNGRFESCSFNDVELKGNIDCVLSCDIANAKVNAGIPLTNCNIVETTLINVRALDCTIEECELQGGYFVRCKICEVTESAAAYKTKCWGEESEAEGEEEGEGTIGPVGGAPAAPSPSCDAPVLGV